MHDILGGSHPSARVVAGIIARTGINGIPFSVPNNNIFPLQGGTPLVNPTNLNNLINPNTAPLITGLNPNTGSNAGSSGGGVNPNSNNQPFVTAGQLPAGLTLQKLIFGSITVFDDELTEGHELGSAVLGRAQGFYLASSVDGTSHTMSMTLMMHGHEHENEHEDTISFFGVHRNAAPVSSVAVVGGTGKYEDAKGYATIEAIQQEDQHVTDGVDTITHINVYLSI
ncbi:Dirigent protein 24 [Linum perenne]